MAKNSKPILSVLIDDDKRTKFADLARRNNLSMGYLVNRAVDRMLELDSIDIYGESARSPHVPNISSLSIGSVDIESLINTSIANLDIENLVKTSIANLNTLSIDSVGIESLFKEYIEKNDIETTSKSSVCTEDIEKIVRIQVEPLADRITELETYTQSQFKAVRDELKKPLAIAR